MNPTFSPAVQAFQAELSDFLHELVPADWSGAGALPRHEYDPFTKVIRQKLHERGYVGVSWPTQYGGRDLSAEYQVAIAEELTRHKLPQAMANDVFGMQMFGNTLLAFGTEEQKKRFIPRIISGEDMWCQGYSEPQAGSDLASVSTSAVLDNGTWHINGQKIWTSFAHVADWIFVLVRTDTSTTKHRGLTLLACPMDQPGIDVRPIRQISGEGDFNEVFFTDAVTSEANTIGAVNEGWRVATALLEHERGGAAAVLAIRFADELDRLEDLAREHGRNHEEDIRQRIAWCRSRVVAMRLMGYRALTRTLAGEAIGPEGAMNKFFWSEYHRVLTELAMDILGENVLTLTGRLPAIPDGPDAPGSPTDSAGWIVNYLNARSSTIFAGTSQVQRNLLSEKILGMPREPRAGSPTGPPTERR